MQMDQACRAMAADILAERLCMQAKFLYNWGQRQGVDLWELATKNFDVLTEGMNIVEAALNDHGLHTGWREK